MGGAYQNSNHPAKFGGHRHCGSRDVFSLPHDLARLRNQGVIWLYGLEPLKVSHHPAKFGDQVSTCSLESELYL